MKSNSWRAVLPFIALAILAEGAHAQEPPQPANANDPVYKVTATEGELKIVENFAKIIELPTRISTVYGFDQEVISVHSVERNPFQIRVFGMMPGITSLVLIDETNQVHTLEVFVAGDVRHLQAYIDHMFPDSTVTAVAVQESVVLRGWVARPEHITQLVEIAEEFYPNVLNQMQVGGVQQVQLRVRVAEVQRAKIRQLGLNFLYINENGFLSSTPGALVPLTGVDMPFGGPPLVNFSAERLVSSTITGGFVNDDHIFQGFLEALKEESLLKILAEPTLTTTNGRPAAMLSGGEFPILVPQSLGTTTIEWREFGVRVEAVPIILGGGRVRINLQPEVSERDFSNSVSTNGVTVPGLTTRRVNTEVEMRFGQTFVLAGLLSYRKTAETSKVPFFGELPYVGKAFRRVKYDEGETELVIMVTPELVAPLSPCELPPGSPGLFTDDPTDRELYCDGVLEVPSYGSRCEGCGSAPLPYPTLSYGFGGEYGPPTGGHPAPPGGPDGSLNVPAAPAPAESNPPESASKTSQRWSLGGLFGRRTAGAAKPGSPSAPQVERPVRRSGIPGPNQNSSIINLNSNQTLNSGSQTSAGRSAAGVTRLQRTDRPGLIEPKTGLIQPETNVSVPPLYGP